MRGRRRLAVLLLAVAGVIPACAAQTADGPSAATSSPEPASPSLVPSASASVDPTAICDEVAQGGPTLEIHVTAASFAFDVDEIEGPIHCEPFVIVFTNSDVPTPDMDTRHNINIRAGNVLGPLLFEGDIIGHGEIRYEVPGLPAGEHYFYCSSRRGHERVNHRRACQLVPAASLARMPPGDRSLARASVALRYCSM